MKTTVIHRPHITWATLQNLASKYAIRINLCGHKVILRSDSAEDLVRMLSAINTHIGE